MATGLVMSSRAITGREGRYCTRHMAIIATQCDTVDFLDQNKTDKSSKFIKKYSGLRIRKSLTYHDFYENEVKKMESWDEVYRELDVSALRDYDSFYINSGIDLHNSNMTRFSNRVGVFPCDNGQLRYQSHGVLFTTILAMLKAHREFGKPLHEYQYDTGEISCRLFHRDYQPLPDLYASYYNHDVPDFGIRRMDSLQYYLKHKPRGLFGEPEKNVDFVFAYTVLKTSTRSGYPPFIEALAAQFDNSKLFTKNEFTGVDTSVDPDVYYDMIQQSRFTLILPAYDAISFAIDRFITALHCNCLPLIHVDANRAVVEDSYGVALDSLVIREPSDAKRISEAKRLELLKFYRSVFLPVERGLVNFSRLT